MRLEASSEPKLYDTLKAMVEAPVLLSNTIVSWARGKFASAPVPPLEVAQAFAAPIPVPAPTR